MLKSTAIVLAVAGLVGAGVTAAILNQQGPARSRAHDGPVITRSTLIVIDGKGAQACSNWAGAMSSCVALDSEQDSNPDQSPDPNLDRGD